MTEPQPAETMLVQDAAGRWHLAIDGGYVYKEDAVRALDYWLTVAVQPVVTMKQAAKQTAPPKGKWRTAERGGFEFIPD